MWCILVCSFRKEKQKTWWYKLFVIKCWNLNTTALQLNIRPGQSWQMSMEYITHSLHPPTLRGVSYFVGYFNSDLLGAMLHHFRTKVGVIQPQVQKSVERQMGAGSSYLSCWGQAFWQQPLVSRWKLWVGQHDPQAGETLRSSVPETPATQKPRARLWSQKYSLVLSVLKKNNRMQRKRRTPSICKNTYCRSSCWCGWLLR